MELASSVQCSLNWKAAMQSTVTRAVVPGALC